MANNSFAITAIFQQLYGATPLPLPQDLVLPLLPSAQSFNRYKVNDQQESAAQTGGFRVDNNTENNLPGNNYNVAGSSKKTITSKGGSLYGPAKDLAGREVFLPLVITDGTKDYSLPYVIITPRFRKIIQETPMVERGGSVKELIGFNDWEFDVKGFLFEMNGNRPSGNNNFPDEEISMLVEAAQVNRPVNFKCAFTDLLMPDSDLVVIKNLEFPDNRRMQGVVPFAFQAVSDSILTLTLN